MSVGVTRCRRITRAVESLTTNTRATLHIDKPGADECFSNVERWCIPREPSLWEEARGWNPHLTPRLRLKREGFQSHLSVDRHAA